jgi:hypothetical protein
LARNSNEHKNQRQVQCRQHGRIDHREHREQSRAAEHEPRFVAVPDGRDGVHHQVALFLIGKERKHDADAQVEAVEHHIHEEAQRDDRGPHYGDIHFS